MENSSLLNSKIQKCDHCGGRLTEYTYGVLKCPYCQKIFKVYNNEIDENLFFKAQSLLKENKFANAIEIFDKILSIDENFPEANWGYVMCQYGIEYVRNGDNSFPSIHRYMNDFSILDNFYVKKVLENTRGAEHDEYVRKINELENLRLEIYEEVKNQKDYDIFIACKVSGAKEGEEFAPEAKWGKEAYNYFIRRGYKVFFSPEELPTTVGNYEPKIYAALQSSELMLLLGSSRENIESKWVYNEWKRFIEISQLERQTNQKHKRQIIPVYSKEAAGHLHPDIHNIEYRLYDDKGKWLNTIEDNIKKYNLCPSHDFESENPILRTIDLKSMTKKRRKVHTQRNLN